MSYIEFDDNRIKKAYREVDNYTIKMKKDMSMLSIDIDTLASTWQGIDSNQFVQQWKNASNNNSTYFRMYNALVSYSFYLKYAEKKYYEAQCRAKNRASHL